MPDIQVIDLHKNFYVAERSAGFWGALRGLVHRRRRTVRALDGISFEIAGGEMVGYIGPNGAGKSTTVKLLSGILVPDSGECTVLGRVPWRERIPLVREIGVVFGQRTQLWWDLPLIESFQILQKVYRIPETQYRDSLDQLIQLLKVAPLLNTPVRQLSLGERMRGDLIAALLHQPRLLFLDEPTIGLDAVAKLALRDFILELNRLRKVTIILTTHDLDDIEALCKRVLVLNVGRLVWDGALADLRAKVAPERRLTIHYDGPPPRALPAQVQTLAQDDRSLQLRFNPALISTPELIAQLASSTNVRDLIVEPQPIEELIAELYRREQLCSG